MSSLGEITTDQDQREKDIQIPVPWGHLAGKLRICHETTVR